jgi:hypothetical protein
MSLAEGNEFTGISGTDFGEAAAAVEGWQDSPASVISHHGGQCCRVAREWLLSMDYSQLNEGMLLTGPRWLRARYDWGPSSWPIYWCEAVEKKTLDCGALAALAQEVFAARGVTCYPAQLIQQYTEDATRHWHKKWDGNEISAHWIRESLIYHEGCAIVVRDNEIKLWDASAGWWVSPEQPAGYGRLLALRVFSRRTEPSISLKWGAHLIPPNEWQKIDATPGDFI